MRLKKRRRLREFAGRDGPVAHRSGQADRAHDGRENGGGAVGCLRPAAQHGGKRGRSQACIQSRPRETTTLYRGIPLYGTRIV